MGSKTSRKREMSKKDNKTFGLVIFSLLCVLIFYPPFFRGLFFPRATLITHILSFSLFLSYLIYKRLQDEKIELTSVFDYIGLLLIIAYALPIIFGQWANLRDAIGELLRYINVFVVYLMVKDFAKEEKYKKAILNTLVASGVAVSLIGLLAAFGYFSLADAVLGNRISSTFQYPNTLAAFTMTLFFIAFYLLNESNKTWQKTLYSVSGFIMFFTFIFTFSRGAWLLFPIFALAFIILLPGKARINGILYLIIVGVPSLIAMQPFTTILSNDGASLKGLLIFIASLGLFTILFNVIEYIKNKLADTHYKYIYIFLGGTALVAAAFIVAALNITQPLVLDNTAVKENIYNQIIRPIANVMPNESYVLNFNVDGINNDENNWPWQVTVASINDKNERSTIIQRRGEANESGEILLDIETLEDTSGIAVYFTVLYPNTKATFYDAALYSSIGEKLQEIKLSYKYIPEAIVYRIHSISIAEHSSTTRITYYKDGIEIFKNHPIIGAGGGAWKSLYPKYQSEPYNTTEAHNYFIQTMVEVGTLGLFLLITLLLTLLYYLYFAVKNKQFLSMTVIIATLSLFAHSFLDFNFSFLSIMLTVWVIIGCLDTKESIKFAKKEVKIPAVLVSIFVLPLLILSISLYSGQRNGDLAINDINSGNVIEAQEHFQRAVKRDPFRETYRLDLANILTNVGIQKNDNQLLEEAKSHYSKAIKHAPYNNIAYAGATNYYLMTGDFEKAFNLIDKILINAPLREDTYEFKLNSYLAVGNFYMENGLKHLGEEMYEKALEVIDNITDVNKTSKKPIYITNNSLQPINRTKYFLNSSDDMLKLQNLNNIAYISYFNIDIVGNNIPEGWRLWNTPNHEKNTTVVASGMEINNIEGQRRGIFSYDFSLQPNTQYTVELELSDNSIIENARVWIYSRSGETLLQHRQDSLEDYTTSFEFTTAEDIEPGNQYFIIEHKGISNGLIIINSIQILQQDYN
ncbi:O-antigen ligase family protein [Alkaliphilus peptidifermentans]|uniref:O-Antigen ligase n=1 Tax=Alkaliphilus peptidifermentans DSM 18978 TaxID=1120976 RepID=A0A1G5AHZ4_9FIRM|nr:O-antigen ligase family protein [Alkaliphilus peptidifermentans]SCX77514.1 O-Antigen ligase [Alkaliphilus peptidifermentans DSM 18978]